MALYYFDTDDGETVTRDEDGLSIADPAAIRAAALAVLPGMARDRLPDGDRRVLSVTVRDARGRHVFHATLTFFAEWLTDPPPSESERQR